MSDLHYPSLASLKVTLVGSGASSRPPVKLPAECLESSRVRSSAQSLHDFSLERNVLKKISERETDQILHHATTREAIEAATLAKMKSVTGAKDEICAAMLESNGYDLKMSIEAFYLR